MKTDLPTLFRLAGLPEPETEHYFHPERGWRFDWAWPELMLAVEYEGLYAKGSTREPGRHLRGDGYGNDCEKYSHAALLGWRVLRFTADMVRDGRALALLQLAANGEKPLT